MYMRKKPGSRLLSLKFYPIYYISYVYEIFHKNIFYSEIAVRQQQKSILLYAYTALINLFTASLFPAMLFLFFP
jgi:hypothetical protein